MSVYIKGMEMPAEETVIVIYKLKGKFYASMHRGELYPLIPVPDHGDLIDRDALEKDIDKYIGGEESQARFHHWVQVQRTVIPKSEEVQT